MVRKRNLSNFNLICSAPLYPELTLTCGEHSARAGESAPTDSQISPDRLIWVVQTYHPQGYEHPRVGVIENARVTGIYDAETGEYLGQSIRRVD